jgi:hypothetical protein
MAEEAADRLIGLAEYLGRRVRVTLAAEPDAAKHARPLRFEGRLRHSGPETLILQQGGRRVVLPAARVERVELTPSGRVRWTLGGALAWGAAAFLFHDARGAGDRTRLGEVGAGLMAGAVVGALYDLARQDAGRVLYQRASPEAVEGAEDAEASELELPPDP